MPIRTCVACRQRFEKSQLLRWVVVAGRAIPDPGARLEGRGAYVCRREECLEGLGRRLERRGGQRLDRQAFQLAARGEVVQNVPGELEKN